MPERSFILLKLYTPMKLSSFGESRFNPPSVRATTSTAVDLTIERKRAQGKLFTSEEHKRKLKSFFLFFLSICVKNLLF